MKKVLCVVLALILVVSLCACDVQTNGSSTPLDDSSSVAEPESSRAESSESSSSEAESGGLLDYSTMSYEEYFSKERYFNISREQVGCSPEYIDWRPRVSRSKLLLYNKSNDPQTITLYESESAINYSRGVQSSKDTLVFITDSKEPNIGTYTDKDRYYAGGDTVETINMDGSNHHVLFHSDEEIYDSGEYEPWDTSILQDESLDIGDLDYREYLYPIDKDNDRKG